MTLKIPTEPRLVEYIRIPGLHDAIHQLRQKAADLTALQDQKPEGQREEFQVLLGFDTVELRAVKHIPLQEDPEQGVKLLQEAAQRLITTHQKQQEARYRKALQEYAEGTITLEQLQDALPDHKKEAIGAVAQSIAATLRRKQ